MPQHSIQSPRFHVAVVCPANFWFQHRSYVYTGLLDLEEQGAITLDLEWSNDADPNLVLLDVHDTRTSTVKRICFDIHDKSYIINRQALEAHAYYFKRSYHRPDVLALPHELQPRVVPWGPIFGLRCRGAAMRRLLWSFCRAPNRDKLSLRRWRERLSNLRMFRHLLRPGAVEHPPDAPHEGTILFQTRLWTNEDVTGQPTASEINARRTALARELKHAFKERFVGGVTATKLAREQCPDLIVEGKTNRRSYIQKMHRSLIGVYTEGLHDSTAWKLGEYLASSLCIVAEPIRNTLPVPLKEANALTFTDNNACLSSCERLLSDPAFALQMRRENQRYYEDIVRPSTNIWNNLEYAFENMHPSHSA